MKLSLVILLAFGTMPFAGAPARSTPRSSVFVVYDGTAYIKKPDLAHSGIKPITVIYSGSLWNSMKDSASIPNANVIRALALHASASTGIAVMDIECWAVLGNPAAVANNIQKYRDTIQLFKQSAPSLRIGYYGIAPVWNYWIAIGGRNTPGYRVWQAENDRVASIGQLADALFPAIYTFYKDQEGWKEYAIAQVEEGRRIAPGKPIYVFLMPQFDEPGKANDYLPPDYWRMELETARQHADGLVIWGGSGQVWDATAPWWLETQSFLKEIGN
jgi:hypothetical protein